MYLYLIHSWYIQLLRDSKHSHCMNPSWVAYLALHHPQPSPQAWIHHGPWKGWKAKRLHTAPPFISIWICLGFWSAAMAPPVDRLSSRSVGAFLAWVVYTRWSCLEMPWILRSTAIWYVWFLTSAKQYKAHFRRKDIRYIQFRNSAPRLPTFAEATGLGPEENHTHIITIHHNSSHIPLISQIFPENPNCEFTIPQEIDRIRRCHRSLHVSAVSRAPHIRMQLFNPVSERAGLSCGVVVLGIEIHGKHGNIGNMWTNVKNWLI